LVPTATNTIPNSNVEGEIRRFRGDAPDASVFSRAMECRMTETAQYLTLGLADEIFGISIHNVRHSPHNPST
jgi:hypothetical protein